ncbi:MAG: S8/S53 family peptidase [Curvibacter sp.]|nr:S8/S53 family peptidase [Curvibacter sp.]
MESKRPLRRTLGLVLMLAATWAAQAQSLPTVSRLAGNTLALTRTSTRLGTVPVGTPMQHITLALQGTREKRLLLERFLQAQQDPTSPQYHQWLTPQQFGQRFGPTSDEVARVSNWLQAQGFTIDSVAASGLWINFSGQAGQVQQAFQTSLGQYLVNGQTVIANDQDPSVPNELAGIVAGPVSLHSLRPAPQHGPLISRMNLTSTQHALAPDDFAAIYNTSAAYAAGIDGTGQSIAIIGRTNPGIGDWVRFRQAYGLSPNTPKIVLAANDPGDLGASEDGEADLDVEWSGAVARGATILFVTAASTQTTDGTFIAAQYAVNNNLAPVLSMSFGLCEASLGSSAMSFMNTLWQQAAAQGMSVVISSGDSGAAGCDVDSSATSVGGKAVNGLASTPYNLAIGGTMFNDASGNYWGAANGNYKVSALGYIPELAWNESGFLGGSNLWATGGGTSSYFSKPAWQQAPGVPADGQRDLPDVSLAAAGHTPYAVMSQNQAIYVGGTSAAAPAFAGVLALLVQATGQRQGNPAARLYQLGNSQYTTGSPVVFHDITSGNNSVPGTTGFQATTAYDQTTGLGSVDVYALIRSWGPTVQTAPVNVGGVYQSTTNGNLYLTAYQSGSRLVVTVYSNAAVSGLTVSSAGGNFAPAWYDYFNLLGGSISGSQGTLSGYDAYRSCNVALTIAFTTSGAATTVTGASATAQGLAQGIQCQQIDAVGTSTQWTKIL